MAQKRPGRSDRLLKVLDAYDAIAVISHDNPDPDAIAAGWAVSMMVRKKLEKPVRVLAGGAVVRAENLRMVELLNPPIELLEQWEPEGRVAVVLVDCDPTADNHLLSKAGIKPAVVIDHHEAGRKRFRVSYRDVRPRVAALSSIMADYIREQNLEPGADLATALMYAIRTETKGWDAVYSRTDRRAISWLTGFYNPDRLSEIENAPLARRYFGDLLLALENTFIYEDAALCFLPRAQGPEIVGEVADLLVRCKDVERILCAVLLDKDLLISVRTTRSGGDAVALLQRTLKKLGHCGGHRHRAGGKVPGVETRTSADDLQNLIRTRWLEACGVQQGRGSRLVAKKDIVLHL